MGYKALDRPGFWRGSGAGTQTLIRWKRRVIALLESLLIWSGARCFAGDSPTGAEGTQMIICRALLATGIVLATIPYAGAQFGGMPGMPGSGGMPGAGFGGPPQAPPPKCQALLSIRDELQKHGMAISAAND